MVKEGGVGWGKYSGDKLDKAAGCRTKEGVFLSEKEWGEQNEKERSDEGMKLPLNELEKGVKGLSIT